LEKTLIRRKKTFSFFFLDICLLNKAVTFLLWNFRWRGWMMQDWNRQDRWSFFFSYYCSIKIICDRGGMCIYIYIYRSRKRKIEHDSLLSFLLNYCKTYCNKSPVSFFHTVFYFLMVKWEIPKFIYIMTLYKWLIFSTRNKNYFYENWYTTDVWVRFSSFPIYLLSIDNHSRIYSHQNNETKVS